MGKKAFAHALSMKNELYTYSRYISTVLPGTVIKGKGDLILNKFDIYQYLWATTSVTV